MTTRTITMVPVIQAEQKSILMRGGKLARSRINVDTYQETIYSGVLTTYPASGRCLYRTRQHWSSAALRRIVFVFSCPGGGVSQRKCNG
jgi:hypothetical protein